ncbi:hypothetical protein AB0465_40560 [Streptomyces griseoviridis]|uniref:hypothetical protein n=1 Tax=Streptomyces griseoviridis TaxID=45398 RepID=UPI003450D023
MHVEIISCADPLELHRRYAGQHASQNAYIELSLPNGKLYAEYDVATEGGRPESVVYGLDRRYTIPVLASDAVNRVLEELAPLADRILADWEQRWTGENWVAVLGEDAKEAEEEIKSRLSPRPGDDSRFDDDDLVQEWDLDGATNGNEIAEYGITPDTTNARLAEIEQKILASLAEAVPAGATVCPELAGYLRELRDDLAEENALSDAEVRTARETLGLTSHDFARLMEVSPDTVRSWEQGHDDSPGRVRTEIAELRAQTDEAVADMVDAYEAGDDDTITTYRNDDEYKAANPGGRWSASWHRQVAACAAARTGARIGYSVDDTSA